MIVIFIAYILGQQYLDSILSVRSIFGIIFKLTVADESRYVFEDVIEYLCKEGFYLSGEEESVCQSNGNWSHSPPICEPIYCTMPPDIDKADVRYVLSELYWNTEFSLNKQEPF